MLEMKMMFAIMLFAWSNVVVCLGVFMLIRSMYDNSFGVRKSSTFKKDLVKDDKESLQKEIYPLLELRDLSVECSDKLDKITSNPNDVKSSEELEVAEEFPSQQDVGNASEKTKEFKESFASRIEEMRSELNHESDNSFMSDVPGIYEYDEDEEYLPSIADLGAGIEIITEEYEKSIEDKLL